MTALVAFINYGGRRGCERVVTVSCDAAPGCRASTSYSDRASYLAAGEAGWRRVERPDAEPLFGCPDHAGCLPAAAPKET